MRKLIVAEHLSLDGVIQAPGGPEEDPSGEFRLGGWTVPFFDIWAAYWPHVPSGNAIADQFNSVPKHVATHRADTLDWHNSHALQGEPADAVRTLKQQHGPNLMTWGSAEMVRQLLAAGLVDEFRLIIYPVVLGRGKRLFDDSAQPSSFTLAHSTRTASGVLLARYALSGEVRTGSFEGAE